MNSRRPTSLNDIRARALKFSKEWANESSESAEAKTFWDEFFAVFGVIRKRVASFEKPVKKQHGQDGRIDLLWKGVLLVEHKSKGKDLDTALKQAWDYFPGLPDRDLPKYIVVSDFARFRLINVETEESFEFKLADLHKEAHRLAFIAGYQTRTFGQQNPVDVQAVERLGKLHDLLRDSGYTGHQLEVLLVRLLFCLFADDTMLFERRSFQDYIEQRTLDDGSDLGQQLAMLFQVLDTPEAQRQKTLDESLAEFPWVNGRLFEEPLRVAAFNRQMREALLDCCGMDWSRINPAIFGSLFQSIMDSKARREKGAHYTTEANILKVLRPLFLDDLAAELAAIKPTNRKALDAFHTKLAGIRILDPACGCGNFLVIAYRELRQLELQTLRIIYRDRLKKGLTTGFPITEYLRLDVDQFYGIEYEEFPAQIAQVALWLVDHQMNQLASIEFGEPVTRLPLKKHASIRQGNALQMDWQDLLPAKNLTYIVGNPPFVGKKEQGVKQKSDIKRTFGSLRGAGILDYVCCWYKKALDVMEVNTSVRTAFVSTNSITQGEQVGVLWPHLLSRGIRIHFAHRTFEWTSEAPKKAAVHCVIIGFGLVDVMPKWIFDYDTPKSNPQALQATNINPYLVDGVDVVIRSRNTPLSPVPTMIKGSEATDDGHLLMDRVKLDALLKMEPQAEPWIRPIIGTKDFINGGERWCLWLDGIAPGLLRSMPLVMQQIELVREFRAHSSKKGTRSRAKTSWLFGENRQPKDGQFLVVPKVSSERRIYAPIGILDHKCVVNNTIQFVPGTDLYHLGILQSCMHMAWMRTVGGRMKSDYQYSIRLVYNNFPWPSPSPTQCKAIERAAAAVLAARSKFPSATLADLYDPLTMPAELQKAHTALDGAVDRAYGAPKFKTEAERVGYLFERYQALVEGLVVGLV